MRKSFIIALSCFFFFCAIGTGWVCEKVKTPWVIEKWPSGIIAEKTEMPKCKAIKQETYKTLSTLCCELYLLQLL